MELGASVGPAVADVRRGVADVLHVPMQCVRLVTSAGVEPNDRDQADVIPTGVTTIAIDRETPFLRACHVALVTDLLAKRDLWLRGKDLAVLPESIGQLTALQELYLGQNHLAALPESIGQLTALRELYLGQNHLAVFSDQLLRLRVMVPHVVL